MNVFSYVCAALFATGLLFENALAGGFAYDTDFVVHAASEETPSAVDRAFAQKVVKAAAKYRSQIAKEWLGSELPPSIGRTHLTIMISSKEDAGRTWPINEIAKNYHNVHLTGSKDSVFGGMLAHEVAHVVLATRYPHPRLLAPWVTEGIATRYDQPSKKAIRAKILAWYTETGNWPKLNSILDKKSILATDKAAYAASASVTEFLLSKDTATKFVKFAERGQSSGWSAALNEFYEIADVATLEAQWRDWVKAKVAVAGKSTLAVSTLR